MPHIGSYDERRRGFDWSLAWDELGWRRGEPLNVGAFCSDRIVARGAGSRIALDWEDAAGRRRWYTFADLSLLSGTAAARLQRLGILAGERVCLFLDRVPPLYFFFLGVLKLGAVVQPLYSAFGEESLFARLADAGTAAVVTQRKHLAKVRRLWPRLPALRSVVVVDADDVPLGPGEVSVDLEAIPPVAAFPVFPAGPDTRSVLHYTSGTTGQPKGVVHVHGSLPAQYLTAKWVLDLSPGDVYWCNADPGWVTGTSYGIIGPWANGVTQVVLDAGFGAEAWYAFLERRRVTVWYSAPTAIRLLMREGLAPVRRHDLSSLRHLASVGEPLNPQAVVWSREAFGKPFHDTFWQTETGAIVIANVPGLPIRPGSMGKPFPGVTAAILHPKTFEPYPEPGMVGLIALKPDFPALLRGYWERPEAFGEKFANGWFLCGDRGRMDADGYFWFEGRTDDVINTGGHLVGPFEVESALLEHPAVAESAAVAKPDPLNMEVVKAYVRLKPGLEPSDELELELMNFVRKRLSPIAMPQEIEFAEGLPKTRSGKIVRRVLRAREFGEPVGDLSAVVDDEVEAAAPLGALAAR